MAVGYALTRLDRSASTGLITIETETYAPFKVGDKVRIYNVLGGGAFPFMAGNPYTIGSVDSQSSGLARRFYFTQTGATASASMDQQIAITSLTRFDNSTNVITVVTATPHNLTTQPRIRISGFQSTNAELRARINVYHQSDNVQVINSTTLRIRLTRNFSDWSSINFSNAFVELTPTGATVALDDGINTTLGGIGGVGIINDKPRFYRLKSEGEVVKGVLSLAALSKGIDYPFLRLFNPLDSSRLSTSPLKTRLNIKTDAASLRSILDTVIESFQGEDAKLRRYFINQDGQLVYDIIDDSKPATATAPYKIVTSSGGDPNTSSVASSIAPFALEVSWDHDTTKRALFRSSSSSGAPIADLIKFDSPDAMGTAYSRPGAPYFDDVVDYPTGMGDRLQLRQQAAKSFFLERHEPTMSGRFVLRGSGTAAWNSLGFSAGYAQITSTVTASVSPAADVLFPVRRENGTASFTTYPFPHNIVAGMKVIVTGISPTLFCGTFTTLATNGLYGFQYPVTGFTSLPGTSDSGAVVQVFPLFVRTGTAPNQIVTASLPTPHGISDGAVTVVSNLTGAAGSSMNGTATITKISDYSFSYPSAGTNGTADGTPTLSSISYVSRWEPGQWVDIQANELGLNGIYRVEQVDWQLEPGSFQQRIAVTFNRRPARLLTKILKEKI